MDQNPPESQFNQQPIPPQPSVAGIPSAETSQPFTITGPAQPIQQEAPAVAAPPPIPEEFLEHKDQAVTQTQPAPEMPKIPQFTPEQPAPVMQPTVQPGPEAVPPPTQPTFQAETQAPVTTTPNNTPVTESQPYPSAEIQTATQTMTPNLGPDVANPQEAQAEAAMAIPHAPLQNNSGGELNTFPDVVVGIDPTAEKSEAKSPATEKRMTDSLTLAQHAWETAGKNTDPEYTKAARAAIQGALERDLTAIMGREWNAPEPEEAWS